jgi:hypothetical protein
MRKQKTMTKKTTKTTKTTKTAKGRPSALTDDKAIEKAVAVLVKNGRQKDKAAAMAYLVACGAKRYLALHRYAESD